MQRAEKSSIVDARLIKLHDWDLGNQQKEKVYFSNTLLIFFPENQEVILFVSAVFWMVEAGCLQEGLNS